MKAIRVFLLLFPLAWPAFAQTGPTIPMSATETIAVTTIADKLRANDEERATFRKALQAVEADIVKAHPGHHLDERSGTIVADPPPPPAPVKPAPATAKPAKTEVK